MWFTAGIFDCRQRGTGFSQVRHHCNPLLCSSVALWGIHSRWWEEICQSLGENFSSYTPPAQEAQIPQTCFQLPELLQLHKASPLSQRKGRGSKKEKVWQDLVCVRVPGYTPSSLLIGYPAAKSLNPQPPSQMPSWCVPQRSEIPTHHFSPSVYILMA